MHARRGGLDLKTHVAASYWTHVAASYWNSASTEEPGPGIPGFPLYRIRLVLLPLLTSSDPTLSRPPTKQLEY